LLKYTFDSALFDENSYKEALINRIHKIAGAATKEFIRATLSRVPVWSGASRASLIPLALQTREGIQNYMSFFNIRPVAFAPRDFPVNDPNHGIASGINRGNKSRVELRENKRNVVYGFTFYTSVFQYWLLEGKWQSIPEGEQAWLRFIKKNAKYALPNWPDHLKVSKINAQ